MGGKANKAQIAIMLGSLFLIFGLSLSMHLPLSNAFGLNAGPAAGDVGKAALPDEAKAANPEKARLERDEELLKVAIDMKRAEKDLKALIEGDGNMARFLDEGINKGLINRGLLVNLMKDQQTVLTEFDKNEADADKAEAEHIHPENPADVDVEDQAGMDGEQTEDNEDDVEVKQLDDEALMKIALKMKLMEQDMKDILKSEDDDLMEFFDPLINKGFIDRPLLSKLVLMRRDLLDAFDKHAK